MASEPDLGMEVVTITGCLFAIMIGGILLISEPSVWRLTPLFVGACAVVVHADTTGKLPELVCSILGFYGIVGVLVAGTVLGTITATEVLAALTTNDTLLILLLTIALIATYTLSLRMEISTRLQPM